MIHQVFSPGTSFRPGDTVRLHSPGSVPGLPMRVTRVLSDRVCVTWVSGGETVHGCFEVERLEPAYVSDRRRARTEYRGGIGS
jgi:hypothetical protein